MKLKKTLFADVYALLESGEKIHLGTTRIHGGKKGFCTRVHTELLKGKNYPVLMLVFPDSFHRKNDSKPFRLWYRNASFHTKVQKHLAFMAV